MHDACINLSHIDHFRKIVGRLLTIVLLLIGQGRYAVDSFRTARRGLSPIGRRRPEWADGFIGPAQFGRMVYTSLAR